MVHDVEPFIGCRGDEMARDELELLIGGRKIMLTARIACAQPSFADGVGNIKIMELMADFCRFGKLTHPCAMDRRIGGNIQDDLHARFQERNRVRRHRVLETRRTADVIGNRHHVAGIQPGQPIVFADHDRSGRFCQLGGQG